MKFSNRRFVKVYKTKGFENDSGIIKIISRMFLIIGIIIIA